MDSHIESTVTDNKRIEKATTNIEFTARAWDGSPYNTHYKPVVHRACTTVNTHYKAVVHKACTTVKRQYNT